MKKIFILYCLIFSANLFAQKAPKGVEIDIHNNDEFAGFEMIENAVKDARIIMSGENHTYVNFNGHMEMKMLRYLNQKTGLKNFIIELGEARAHFLNRYINNDDSMAEKYLKATTSPRYMDLFKRIRKYNLDLPDTARIRIFGIDVERFYDLPLIRLDELIMHDQVPATLRVFEETVHGTAAYLRATGLSDYEIARDKSKVLPYFGSGSDVKFYMGPTVRDIVKYWDSLNPEIRIWLGSKYNETEHAIQWLKQYLQWKRYENTTFQYIWREENIFKNLTKLIDEKPLEKFYGQFGRCHIAYEEQNGDCSWYGYHSVVNKLRSRYYKDPKSVVAIGIFYKGTGESNYYSEYEERDGLNKEINALSDETKLHSVTLFNLNHEDAELPLLKQKFSFVVVDNRFVTIAEKDSVESEISNVEPGNVSDFNPYSCMHIGVVKNLPYSNSLGNYIDSKGGHALAQSSSWTSVAWNTTGKRFSFDFGYQWKNDKNVMVTDTGNLKYAANFGFARLVYYPLVVKQFQMGVGLNLGLGNEKIIWEPANVNFITVNNPKKFVNPVCIVGPLLRVQTTLWDVFYLSAEATKNIDLSKNQWYYHGSRQKYGAENGVTKGLGGFYLGFSIGIAITDY